MDQYTRRIVGFGVHGGTLNGVALCKMFNRAIRGQLWMPKYISSDNDPLFRFVLDFRTYFNSHRTHTSREGRTPDTPLSRPIANLHSFQWQPHCRALYQTPVAA